MAVNSPAPLAVLPRLRRPAVAGYFYPSDPDALRADLDAFRPAGRLTPATAVVAPHGSLAWSGRLAAGALGTVDLPRRVILVGPSHTGRAGGWSLMAAGAYETPLGEVPVDDALAADLHERCPFIEPDPTSQFGEHAIEVLVPFLQRYGPADLAIVPVICGNTDATERVQAASALAALVRNSHEPVLLVASTDLTHFEPAGRAASLDRLLISRICAVDPDGLMRVSREHGTRMCGDDAAACILQAAALLGGSHGRVTGAGTSAEQGGDPDSAIGYAGIVIT